MDIIKFIKKTSKKAGMRPGSVVFVGKKKVEKQQFELIDYDERNFTEKELKNIEEAFHFKNLPTVTWLDVTGLHEIENIEKLGSKFGLHPLIQEDIVNTGQRPMIEDFDNHIFVTLKMISYNKDEEIDAEHVSIVMGKNFVLSFQEREGDVFTPVRERVKASRWRIRKHGSDYLTYALMDSIVDHYFIVLEKIGDKIEDLEEELNFNPEKDTISKIHKLKRELIYLRKSVWPLREVISRFSKSESKLIKKQTRAYITDLYDHTIQVIDTVESFRDMTSGMMDLYLSSVSNRMNEIMKVLTIFAAIFIPLTFIAGVYGMNFNFIPELSWKFGYAFAWGLFVLLGVGMLFYFRKRRWI